MQRPVIQPENAYGKSWSPSKIIRDMENLHI
jgi:hypothetical protein